MVNLDCQSRRSTKISVIILGGALCTVMMAYFVFGDNNDEQGLRNLRMISIVFRHGEKTPSSFYPTDPHALHEWPGGLGALTQKGSQQAYNLGKNLRMRYYRLLPPNGIYTQQQVLASSSAAERCIMSAQSVLAGFMPPLDHNKVLPIPWQPAAVNVIPRSEDTLLAQKKPCLKYDTILQKLYKNPPPELRKLNEENAELFKLLTKHSGKNISTLIDVEMLYTTLKVEAEAGLVLPDWTENIYPDKLESLAARSYSLYTESNLMKKVKGGAFLAEIIKKMENKRRKNLNPDRKIFLYSGHDITLVNIMNTLNILDQTDTLPSYASALSFELHHSSLFKDDFEVKIVYYYNSEDKFPKEIHIPNCNVPCSLTQFSNSINHLLLDDYDDTCENPTTDCKN
ncbi:PREDICTED: lysosomal acid phosphatase [Bactrocera latifrons]|uniref:Lysosomal acid phosphatase n=5 Tax=Bactrocera TaxID=47832 RepID=A0A034W8E2_BACDO|nr:PREDICTED: lysosomal acid phosphatase [Bactrocera latifrons]XP_018785613.1 PREDICTED: lysosomal acid phosphatase [Bactrocera latifrons]XP_049317320.1 lysosomal acid phosphatase-like [Bactrocera dorsalis]XP_050316975.1 lysosomal acid phosphatase [Bactrocera neohumeralis]